MKGAKIIGIDFDDVIVSTNEAMSKWHNRVYGTSYTRADISSYDLTKIWHCSHNEMNRRIHEFFHSAEHSETAPVIDAVQSLDLLRDREIHIITARRSEFSAITLLLAERHVPFLLNNFNFPNTGQVEGFTTKRTKAQVCLELGVEVFIDDHLEYALDISSVGIPVLLFDVPWNQTDKELPGNVTRIYSWAEAVKKLK